MAAGGSPLPARRRSVEPSPGAVARVARRPSAVPEATASKQPTAPQKQRSPSPVIVMWPISAAMPAAAVQQAAVGDDAAADAGRDGDEDQRAGAVAGPKRHSPRAAALASFSSRTGRPSRRSRMSASGTSCQPASVGGPSRMPARGCRAGPGAPTPMPTTSASGPRIEAVARARRSGDHHVGPPCASRHGGEGEDRAVRRPGDAELGAAEIDRERGDFAHPADGQRMQPAHARRKIRGAEGERAQHHGLGAGGAQQRHGLVADAAVGGEDTAASRSRPASAARASRSRSQAVSERLWPLTPIAVPSSVTKATSAEEGLQPPRPAFRAGARRRLRRRARVRGRTARSRPRRSRHGC